ncbi:MAG: Nramp family divalent metal transporter [Pseudomonadota bacterium]
MSSAPRRWRPGPGLLVTAAFIGPGTLTTASLAGAQHGLQLWWALIASLIATLVLQDMALRVGLGLRSGLSEAVRQSPVPALLKTGLLALIVVAVGIGNAAYQSGNLLGAQLGFSGLLPGSSTQTLLALSALASVLLWSGSYRLIQTALVVLVAIMGALFLYAAVRLLPGLTTLTTAPAAHPDTLLAPAAGDTPTGAIVSVMALIGTTVVPYNLFLHAQTVQVSWSETDSRALRQARWDSVFAIALGGAITFAIMVTATAAFFGRAESPNAATLATQLQPLLGPWAQWVFSIGLFAAGLTSAITAPLAAAWAVCGACGWSTELTSLPFRGVWLAVLTAGTGVAVLQTTPVQAIVLAQVANATLLPAIAGILLWLCNQPSLLGEFRNTTLANCLGGLVIAFVTLLAGYRLIQIALS